MNNIFNEEFKNEDLLRYGEILTDDEYGGYILEDNCTRIRTIKYSNHVYYYKMTNGKVTEVKELM